MAWVEIQKTSPVKKAGIYVGLAAREGSPSKVSISIPSSILSHAKIDGDFVDVAWGEGEEAGKVMLRAGKEFKLAWYKERALIRFSFEKAPQWDREPMQARHEVDAKAKAIIVNLPDFEKGVAPSSKPAKVPMRAMPEEKPRYQIVDPAEEKVKPRIGRPPSAEKAARAPYKAPAGAVPPVEPQDYERAGAAPRAPENGRAAHPFEMKAVGSWIFVDKASFKIPDPYGQMGGALFQTLAINWGSGVSTDALASTIAQRCSKKKAEVVKDIGKVVLAINAELDKKKQLTIIRNPNGWTLQQV